MGDSGIAGAAGSTDGATPSATDTANCSASIAHTMIGAMRKMEKLSAQQISVRAWLLGSAGVFVIVMHAIEPERIAQWVPLPTSCGAITGLPVYFAE